jgi:prevent-host-death family protein
MTYTLQQARTNLAQLLAEAEQGKEVVIERDGQPAVRLAVTKASSATAPTGKRVLGQFRGLAEYDDSAFDPLTEEELVEYGFGFMLERKLVSEEAQEKKAG